MQIENEIGKTLDRTLRLFRNKNLGVEELMQQYHVSDEIARELIFALVKRGYIVSSYSKNYLNPEDVDIAEYFRITVEGSDYLELHKAFWQRFWFRFIGCPVIVAFITAINAEPIWTVMLQVSSYFSQILRELLSR